MSDLEKFKLLMKFEMLISNDKGRIDCKYIAMDFRGGMFAFSRKPRPKENVDLDTWSPSWKGSSNIQQIDGLRLPDGIDWRHTLVKL